MYSPIKCVQIEMTEPGVTVGARGYAKVRALVRFDGVPLGTVVTSVVNGEYSTDMIAQTARGLYKDRLSRIVMRRTLRNFVAADPFPLDRLIDLPAQSLSSAGQDPQITIAVCTRDRADRLRGCLDAILKTQGVAFEVVVVDNAPATDATRDLIAHQFPSVRYVLEPRPGLDWARNRAVLEARAGIVAFADDDVFVDPKWAKSLHDVFQMDLGVMCVTGLVEPYELETEAQWQFEQMGGFGRGYDRKWYRVNPEVPGQWWYHGSGRFGTGANMAYRKTVFEQIGLFDPALDVGTPTGGGGDLEMFFRVLHEGHALVYEPSAIVLHQHRRTYQELLRQIKDNGAIYSYFHKAVRDYPDQRMAFAQLVFWYLFFYQVKRLVPAMLHQGRVGAQLFWEEIRGGFGAAKRYRLAERRAGEIAAQFGVPEDAPERPAPRGLRFSALRKRSIGVRNLDLVDGFKAEPDDGRYGSLRVFVKMAGFSLGQVDVANAKQPLAFDELLDEVAFELTHKIQALTAARSWDEPAIASLAGFVESLYKRIDGSVANREIGLPAAAPVSIVVATYDRPDDLRACLTALSAQKTDRPVEIIVVDNHAPSGITAPVVAEFPGVRYVAETKQGSSYARNTGICASSGQVVVTTDDDVLQPPDWLENIVEPFARADVMAVTGNVLPYELESYSQWQFEAYGGLGRGYKGYEVDGDWFDTYLLRAVPTWELGATANSAFRACVFADPQVGLMEESLGAGMPSGVGEDSYLFYKIVQAGYTIRYEPAAYVWHKHRSDLASLRKQIYNYSKGHVAHHLTTLFRDRDLRALWQIFVILPLWRVKQVLWTALKGLLSPAGSDAELPQAGSLVLTEIAGNFAGPLCYLRSQMRVASLGRSAPYVPVEQRAAASSVPGETRLPVFSIVVPCYNCAAFVGETLDSVLTQARSDWELIAVDDGSKDETVAVLHEYAARDPRIRVACQPNGGVSVARNHGLSLARGEWILFLDSDDWIKPDYLSRMGETIAAHPDRDLIHCGWTGITPEGVASDPEWFLGGGGIAGIRDNANEAFFEVAANVCPFIIHAAVVRRDLVLLAGGFDPSLKTSEDWDLWQRLARIGTRKFMIPDVLCSYRMRPESLTRSGVGTLRDGLAVLKRGHGVDPRLAGVTGRVLLTARNKQTLRLHQVYLAVWAAGALIGKGGSAAPVFAEIDDVREPLGDANNVSAIMMRSAVVSACRKPRETYAVYRDLEAEIEEFLLGLEDHLNYPGLARATAVRAERFSIETSFLSEESPDLCCAGINEVVGRTQVMSIDASRPIEDLVTEDEWVERLIAVLIYEGAVLGEIELPFVDGRVSSYVFYDAIAAEFAEPILDRYLASQAYGNLRLTAGAQGYSVTLDKSLIVSNAGETEIGKRDLFKKIGEPILWSELFGEAYEDYLTRRPFEPETSYASVLESSGQEIPAIELSQPIPAIRCAGPSLSANILVGGVPVGIVSLDADSSGMVAPKDFVHQLLNTCWRELMRAVARAVIVGRPADQEPYSLRERLRDSDDWIGGDLRKYIGISRSPDEEFAGIAGISECDLVIGQRDPDLVGSAASRRYVLPGEIIGDMAVKGSGGALGPVVKRSTNETVPDRVVYTPEILASHALQQGAWSPRRPALALRRQQAAVRQSNVSFESRCLPVLMYHSVAATGPAANNVYRVTPEQFEEQLHFLRSEGYHSISLPQWEAAQLTETPIAGKPVVLTFDDGFCDFAGAAWPLLKKYGMTATVFLVAGLVGKTNAWERYATERIPLMDWDAIRHLQGEGCDFGSHTLTHPRLTSLTVSEIAREGLTSKAIIESELGREVRSIAYPFGDFDRVVAHIMGACGYSVGLSDNDFHAEFASPILELPRVNVNGLLGLNEYSWQLNASPRSPRRVRTLFDKMIP